MFSAQHPFQTFWIDGDPYLGTLPSWNSVKRLLEQNKEWLEECQNTEYFLVRRNGMTGPSVDAIFFKGEPARINNDPQVIFKDSMPHTLTPDRFRHQLCLRPLLIPLTKDGKLSPDLRSNRDGDETTGGTLYVRTGTLSKNLEPVTGGWLPEADSLFEIGDTCSDIDPLRWFYVGGCLLSRDVLARCSMDSLINCGWMEHFLRPGVKNYFEPFN